MVAQGERLQDICKHDRVSFDTDKYVPPCFCVLQSSMLCSGSDAFPAAPHSFSSLIQSLPSCWGWVCRAPKLRGLRILEIVMENKGGVTIPRWAFGLAAAVVALLVVLVIVLIPRGGDNSNTSAAGSSNSEQSRPASSSTAEPSVSALAASSSASANARATCNVIVPSGAEYSDKAPENLAWQRMPAGIEYPISPTYGPIVRVGHVGQCYAHTPTGSALAAAGAITTMSNSESSEAERMALLSSRRDTSEDNLWHPAADDKKVDAYYVGYEIQSYSPEQSVVYLYIRYRVPSSMVVRLPIRMVWEDGDWRLDSNKSEMQPVVLTDQSQLPSHVFKQSRG